MQVLTKSEFPSLLAEINDPPERLFIEGSLPPENDYEYLAVVGSRNFSPYGKEACERLIDGLAGYPIAIVSGLAIGMDSIAHKAALRASLPTVAIPGSGLDESVLYPAQNRFLARDIVSAGGALLSENEPLFKPYPHSFPSRNRIIAGMCKAVLVVEAGEKSGTLITARLALDYNRDVLVVPGSIFSKTSKGSNSLIRSGASPVMSSEDILHELGLAPKEQRSFNLSELTHPEQKLLEILTEPMHRDLLFETAKITPAEGTVLLMTMELKGLIKEAGGDVHNLTL